jgi:NADPH2:quinone reductase
MRAVVITRPGGPDVLEVRDVPRPLPREHEVLVRVHATALNRADLLQRAGRYPAPPGAPADIPGLEIAGEVADIGAAVRMWKPGDRVFGIVGGGGYAEFAVVHEAELARVPEGMSWDDAAAVPEAFITAHDALISQAAMQPGERVIIHAVGSGVGLAAVQLVRAFGGKSFGTARTSDKIERASSLGLDGGEAVADPAEILELVRTWSGGAGANVALDLVGGAYLPATVESMATLGRIVLIGLLAGRLAEVNLGTVLSRRITIRGTVLRSRPAIEKAAATAAFSRDVLPLLSNGRVRPVIDTVLPLDRVAEAHALLEGNRTFGKVVLRIDG